MKKVILSIMVILAILVTLSFTILDSNNGIMVKITVENPTEFNMVQNGIITKGLITPFEFEFKGNRGNFIFKSNNDKKELKIDVKTKKSGLTAEWGIIVLTIDNDKMTTFGMN
ncbi:MAG: hypothetical protein L3J20_04505 [Flavobacteriaceae bacterium]|nr:hypothetical protein [Flavobacteriaceae bacterium]